MNSCPKIYGGLTMAMGLALSLISAQAQAAETTKVTSLGQAAIYGGDQRTSPSTVERATTVFVPTVNSDGVGMAYTLRW